MAKWAKQFFAGIGSAARKFTRPGIAKKPTPGDIKRRQWEQRIIHRMRERQRGKEKISGIIKKANLGKQIAKAESEAKNANLSDVKRGIMGLDSMMSHVIDQLNLTPAKRKIVRALTAHLMRIIYCGGIAEAGDGIKVKDARIIFDRFIRASKLYRTLPKQKRKIFDLEKLGGFREASELILKEIKSKPENEKISISPGFLNMAQKVAIDELGLYLGSEVETYLALLDETSKKVSKKSEQSAIELLGSIFDR